MRQAGRQTRPLEAFRRFQTDDLDLARDIVSRHFCSHRLDRMATGDRLDACQHRVEGRKLSLNYIRYGADVEIEPGELGRFYLIQIPLAGHAAITNGRRSFETGDGIASILNPTRHTAMRWRAGCEQLLLQIDRGYLNDVARQLADADIRGDILFDPRLDTGSGAMAAWTRALRAAVGAAEAGEIFVPGQQRRQTYIEESLVIGLLESQFCSARPLLDRPQGECLPGSIRRARAMIHDRFSEPLTLLEIAAAAGVTARSLQLGFRRAFDMTPMQYLQLVRLNFARHLLMQCSRDMNVSDIAGLSGHWHLGRFSQAYRRRFGEEPRQTRRNRWFA